LQRRFVSLAFVAAFIALCPAACSGQGEGQRCSLADDPGGPNNTPGSSDCSGNLVCLPASDFQGLAADQLLDPNLGICCPAQRVAGDPVAICALGTSPADAAPPADASSNDAPSEGSDGSPQADGPLIDGTLPDGTDGSPIDAGQIDAGQTEAGDSAPGTDAPADVTAG
jgi:hypothetical protein